MGERDLMRRRLEPVRERKHEAEGEFTQQKPGNSHVDPAATVMQRSPRPDMHVRFVG